MSLRAVCFDLFNTLVDVGRVPESVGRYTADILGVDRQEWNRVCFSAEHEICQATVHIDVLRTLARGLRPDIPEALIEQAAVERQARFDHALRHVDESICAALATLKQRGLKLALVSNASTDEVAAWDESPLRQFFEHALFSCHVGCAKPQPAIYEQAAQRLQVAADHCLFVGDGGSDEHRGAARVGMIPVLITYFLTTRLSADELAHRRRHVAHQVHLHHEIIELV